MSRIKMIVIGIIAILLIVGLYVWIFICTPMRPPCIYLVYPDVSLEAEKHDEDNYTVKIMDVKYKDIDYEYHWYDYWIFKRSDPNDIYQFRTTRLSVWKVFISKGINESTHEPEDVLFSKYINEIESNVSSLVYYIDYDSDRNLSVGDQFVIRGELANKGRYLIIMDGMLGDTLQYIQYKK